jgi:hypothetical protein
MIKPLQSFEMARALLAQATTKSLSFKEVCSELESLETFADRIKFAKKHLKHLSSGSSRVVYLTPQNTILKLAKNDRGLAQNKVESNPKMKSKFINKVKGFAKNHEWIHMEYRDKITTKQFEKMTDIPFKEFGDAIKYGLRKLTSKPDRKEPKNFDSIKSSKIYKEFLRLGEEFQLMPGDMARISSFGEHDGHPILLDAGLTKNIFDEFY